MSGNDLLRSNMNNKFSLEVVGDVDLEGMAIDVCYNDLAIASVNYENGIENIEIEIFSSHGEILGKHFNLQDFINILEKAKKLSIQCYEEDKLIEWPKMDETGASKSDER